MKRFGFMVFIVLMVLFITCSVEAQRYITFTDSEGEKHRHELDANSMVFTLRSDGSGEAGIDYSCSVAGSVPGSEGESCFESDTDATEWALKTLFSIDTPDVFQYLTICKEGLWCKPNFDASDPKLVGTCTRFLEAGESCSTGISRCQSRLRCSVIGIFAFGVCEYPE